MPLYIVTFNCCFIVAFVCLLCDHHNVKTTQHNACSAKACEYIFILFPFRLGCEFGWIVLHLWDTNYNYDNQFKFKFNIKCVVGLCCTTTADLCGKSCQKLALTSVHFPLDTFHFNTLHFDTLTLSPQCPLTLFNFRFNILRSHLSALSTSPLIFYLAQCTLHPVAVPLLVSSASTDFLLYGKPSVVDIFHPSSFIFPSWWLSCLNGRRNTPICEPCVRTRNRIVLITWIYFLLLQFGKIYNQN